MLSAKHSEKVKTFFANHVVIKLGLRVRRIHEKALVLSMILTNLVRGTVTTKQSDGVNSVRSITKPMKMLSLGLVLSESSFRCLGLNQRGVLSTVLTRSGITNRGMYDGLLLNNKQKTDYPEVIG